MFLFLMLTLAMLPVWGGSGVDAVANICLNTTVQAWLDGEGEAADELIMLQMQAGVVKPAVQADMPQYPTASKGPPASTLLRELNVLDRQVVKSVSKWLGWRKLMQVVPHEKLHNSTGHSWQEPKRIRMLLAVSLLCTLILSFLVFALTRTNTPNVASCTVQTLDRLIAAFLAMLWIHAIQGIVNTLTSPVARTIAFLSHAMLLLAMTCAGAWLFRESKAQLHALCSCAVYFIAFAWAYAAMTIHRMFLPHLASMYLAGILITILLLVAVAATLYLIKKTLGLRHADEQRSDANAGRADDKYPVWARRIPLYTSNKSNNNLESQDDSVTEWAERIEVIENEYGALTLAMLWTNFVSFIMVGEQPEKGQSRGLESQHSSMEGNFLMYAFALLLACGVLSMLCGKRLTGANLRYFQRRSVLFLSSFLAMSTAWAFLEWSETEIVLDQLLYCPACAYWLISTVGVVVMLGRIVAVAHSMRGRNDPKAQCLSLKALALMVGWSLEQCLNSAVAIHTQGWPRPDVARVVAALSLGAVAMPIYIIYLKPITFGMEGV